MTNDERLMTYFDLGIAFPILSSFLQSASISLSASLLQLSTPKLKSLRLSCRLGRVTVTVTVSVSRVIVVSLVVVSMVK